MPAPGHDLLLSLPLSLAVLILVLPPLVTGFIVWYLQRRRAATATRLPFGAPWLDELLAALPCAALLADTGGKVRVANDRARRWLTTQGPPVALPQTVQALVRRVGLSGHEEGVEVLTTNGHDSRSWVQAAVLSDGAGVLVLVRDEAPEAAQDRDHRGLAQSLAHELRTPLTAILGHADILASCSIDEETLWRRSQQFISNEAERLARLVEDLLALAYLDASAPALAPVNVRAVAEGAISAVWQAAEEKGVTLALQAAEGLPRVRANADWLHRVFTNLLDNGIKYTPPAGQVTVRLTPNARCVRVEVADTGIGIAADDLAHVFEPFFRSDEARKAAPGTGLGLALLRSVLAQHGSEIRVDSQPGHGTTFSFDLHIA